VATGRAIARHDDDFRLERSQSLHYEICKAGGYACPSGGSLGDNPTPRAFGGARVGGGWLGHPIPLVLARALQGLGGGGLMALAQTIIADIVSPRERGRYQGYNASIFGLASIGGLISPV